MIGDVWTCLRIFSNVGLIFSKSKEFLSAILGSSPNPPLIINAQASFVKLVTKDFFKHTPKPHKYEISENEILNIIYTKYISSIFIFHNNQSYILYNS